MPTAAGVHGKKRAVAVPVKRQPARSAVAGPQRRRIANVKAPADGEREQF